MAETRKVRTPRHPVRVVTERTGLSADVLRAWERRYRLVRPGRSDGGHRLYSDADIERLALVHKATQGGRSVALVARLSAGALARLVAEDAEGRAERPGPAAWHRVRAAAAVRDLAPERLEGDLRRAVLSLGAPAFLDEVLAPLLAEVGDAWHAGRLGVAQEHAATAVVQRVLGWLLAEFDAPGEAPRLVVATPQGERHALGALMAAVLAVHDGWRVTWLGADVPAGQIAEAARLHGAAAVGLSAVTPGGARALRSALRALRRALDAGTSLLVGGAAVRGLGALGEGITSVRDLSHWRTLLRARVPARQAARLAS